MLVAIHINFTQAHQQEHGQWLKAGLEKHGLDVKVTPSITMEADIHIISGPHYAKDYWQGHPNVIWLDRAYLPEHQIKTTWVSEDWVSLGWMRDDGGRDFRTGVGRQRPTVKTRKSGGRTLFLADYNGRIDPADTIRLHPAAKPDQRPLHEDLHEHDIAIGYQTTALVAAGLEGLQIDCRDPRNIMSESNWLDLLPYADWHYSEIQSGEAIAHLWERF